MDVDDDDYDDNDDDSSSTFSSLLWFPPGLCRKLLDIPHPYNAGALYASLAWREH